MSANSRRLEVAVGRRLAHSLARMMRLHPHLRSPVSARRAGVALIAALVAAWPAAGAPELSATGAAIATGSDLLETSIVVEKLVPAARPAGGSGRFVAAERLDAGEVAYYTIRVRNPGKMPVSDVQITKRMPDGMQYIEGSAVGPASDVQFSTDGGETFLAGAAGSEYTHLRWILRQPLPPGATALLRFRATFR